MRHQWLLVVCFSFWYICRHKMGLPFFLKMQDIQKGENWRPTNEANGCAQFSKVEKLKRERKHLRAKNDWDKESKQLGVISGLLSSLRVATSDFLWKLQQNHGSWSLIPNPYSWSDPHAWPRASRNSTRKICEQGHANSNKMTSKMSSINVWRQ